MADQNTTFYALFDGEDVDGKRYGVGEPIDANVPAAVLTVLRQMGRVSDTPPAVTAPIPNAERPVDDMGRVELEQAATNAMQARMADASDDDLRRMVQAHRDELARESDDKRDDPEGVDAKPLERMNTAELTAVAERENVTFGDDVKTNADRAKAITDARAAK